MRVQIVGAGVAGLSEAYRLLQMGHEVEVWEARPEVGGQVITFPTAGDRIEAFYHHLFTNDRDIVELVEELGLGGRMTWRESKLGFFSGGRIYPFVTPGDLLRFTPLPLPDRVRLGLAGLYLRYQSDWRRYEKLTAREWIRRHAGGKAYDVVWGPLLRGKFGRYADEVGMAWYWGKVHLRFASRKGGVSQKELLGYLLGSFAVYIEALADRIRDLGGKITCGAPVEGIAQEGGRAVGVRVGGELRRGDAVLLTVPNSAVLRLAPGLPEEYSAILRSVRYQWATCLILALDRPLTNTYWCNIGDRDIPFVACVEHTNFIEPERYGGQHLVYLSNYVEDSSPYIQMDEDAIWETYLPYVKKLNPAFQPSWVTQRWLFKDPGGQPLIGRFYSRSVPPHRTPMPGLWLANTTQIYPEDRGQNYSIRMGQQVAKLIDTAGP